MFTPAGTRRLSQTYGLADILSGQARTRPRAAADLPATSYDVAVLTLLAFSLLSLLINAVFLLWILCRRVGESNTGVLTIMTISNIVHLICLLVYSIQRQYDSIVLNFMATASMTITNWSYIILMSMVLMQIYVPKRYQSWCSQTKLRLCLLFLVVLGCVPAIPGLVETEFYRASICAITAPDKECTEQYRSILLLQTKLVPSCVIALPLLGSIIMMIIALNRYKPRGLEVESEEEEQEEATPGELTEFSDSSIQSMLTTVWFIVYYLTSVMLLLIIDASDGGYHELKGARGLIKTALMFRVLNLPISLYINLICSAQFRREIKAMLSRKKEEKLEPEESCEIEESMGSRHKSYSI